MTMIDAPRLLRDTAFGTYFRARTYAFLGTAVSFVCLPVLAYEVTGSASATGMVAAAESLAYVVFGLPAGVIADAWDRRKVFAGGEILGALVVASFPVAHWLGTVTYPHVIVAAFLMASLAVIVDGAALSVVPTLVGRDRLVEANSRLWTVSSMAEAAMPPLVGVMLVYASPATLMAVNAVTFLMSARLVLTLTALSRSREVRKTESRTARSLGYELVEGLVYLWRHTAIRALTVASALQCFTAGALAALLVPFADQQLGVGTSGARFGLVFSAWGIGGVVGTLVLPLLTRFATAPQLVRWMLVPIIGSQALTILAPVWWVAVVGLFVWGGCWLGSMIAAVSYRQEATPDELLGRVNTAGRMVAAGIGTASGAAVAGALALTFEVQQALAVTAVIGLLAVPTLFLMSVPATAPAQGD
jgi:MFS family permease